MPPMGIDIALFRLINGWAGQHAGLDALARLLVNDYFVTTVMALVVLSLWLTPGDPFTRMANQRVVFQTVLAVLVSNVLLKGINLVYFRPRPFDALPDVTLLFYKPTDSSLPSNPATLAFAIATAVYLHHRPAGRLMYGLATLFALSRVYCGVHYPLDIVAGAGLGSVTALWVVRRTGWLDPLWHSLIRIGRRFYLA